VGGLLGTDERLARPRMTGTVIRTFGGADRFRLGSLLGTDERLARPRMTGDGHPYLCIENLLAVLGVFSTSCCGGGVGNLEGAGRGSSLRGNEKGMVCNFIVWVGCTQALFTN